jgi:hypothetical protein
VKKLILAVLALSLIVPAALVSAQDTAAEEPFLFRGLPWGSTREEVIAKEGDGFRSALSGDNEILFYQDLEIGALDTDLMIIIDPKYGLTRASYLFAINTSGFPYNTKPYIDSYSSLYNLLSEIYGPPVAGSQAAGSRGTDLDDFMEYYYKGGQAAAWDPNGTVIYLRLDPQKPAGYDLADWGLTIMYISPYAQERARAESRSGL